MRQLVFLLSPVSTRHREAQRRSESGLYAKQLLKHYPSGFEGSSFNMRISIVGICLGGFNLDVSIYYHALAGILTHGKNEPFSELTRLTARE